MTQTLYGILAMSMLMLVMLNLNRGVVASGQKQAMNELTTPMIGVAADVFEHVDRMYYDRHTARHVSDETQMCGRITDRSQLTAAASFAPCTWGATPEERFQRCPYVEGIHGMTDLTFERDGYIYAVDLAVRYVDEATLDPVGAGSVQGSQGQTYAKEVEVTITNQFMDDAGGAPLEVRIARSIHYDRITIAPLMPYYGPDAPCPAPDPYPVIPAGM